jgi:HlyD family secretion protein
VPLASVTTRNPDDDNPLQNNNSNNSNDSRNVSNQTTEKKTEKQEDKIVIFVNENGVAKMVEVKTGISDYDNIEIVSGVTDSTEVVVGPFLAVSKRLKDGEKIRRMESKEPGNNTN